MIKTTENGDKTVNIDKQTTKKEDPKVPKTVRSFNISEHNVTGAPSTVYQHETDSHNVSVRRSFQQGVGSALRRSQTNIPQNMQRKSSNEVKRFPTENDSEVYTDIANEVELVVLNAKQIMDSGLETRNDTSKRQS